MRVNHIVMFIFSESDTFPVTLKKFTLCLVWLVKESRATIRQAVTNQKILDQNRTRGNFSEIIFPENFISKITLALDMILVQRQYANQQWVVVSIFEKHNYTFNSSKQ